ncbi:MAG: WYL domain-containing protein [Verrucomicrobiota bacterium]
MVTQYRPALVSDPSDHHMALVNQAMVEKAVLQLLYEDRDGNRTLRRIHPEAWKTGDRFSAWCELRGDIRDFRVHRFVDCRLSSLPDENSSG